MKNLEYLKTINHIPVMSESEIKNRMLCGIIDKNYNDIELVHKIESVANSIAAEILLRQLSDVLEGGERKDMKFNDDYLSNVTRDGNCEEVKKRLGTYLYPGITPKSNMKVCDAFLDKYGTAVVKVSGGLNGHGKWEDYFDDMSMFIKKMREKNIKLWLIDWVNDCPDDVFDAYLGMDTVTTGVDD